MTSSSKKNKAKKVPDPTETSKLLAAKISQLEQDAAGEKDQEAEIGMFSGSLRKRLALTSRRTGGEKGD